MGDQDEESWRPSYMRRVGCVHIFLFGVFLTSFFSGWCLVYPS